MRGEAHASLKNALEVFLSRTSLDLGPRVSHHTSNYPIETGQLSLLHWLMWVDLTKTARRESRWAGQGTSEAPGQLQIIRACSDGLQARLDDCRPSRKECGPEGGDRCRECGPENALIAVPARFNCSPLQLQVGGEKLPVYRHQCQACPSKPRAADIYAVIRSWQW